ncbi:CHAD domain-containing protein [Pseudomonas cavernae]|uniref:CHAD domain-containing protein n=1 Tax=Pseudomonas cavernae TaxID=2320867 RepID=A0A385Z273_9PSED|nr:CHAD domain-containing protein [Pseudomonas cavernae]AYC33355.1 CHAD domain-containing protein [Pseudomonas cavernae]
MSAFVDDLIAQVLTLDITLHACRERLAARTDSEALHDLRIALRRLRSLLRPLRKVPAVEPLENAAKAVGKLSGPLRDDEVLLGELQRQGRHDLLTSRQAGLEHGYAALLASAELRRLFQVLDAWPQLFRQAQREQLLQGARKRVGKTLARQQRQLAEALRDPAHDRHRLRLLIKRMRYGSDAYPQLTGVAGADYAALKAAQSALGDWHDLMQWLARVEREAELAALAPLWQQALQAAEGKADQALEPLLERFTKS